MLAYSDADHAPTDDDAALRDVAALVQQLGVDHPLAVDRHVRRVRGDRARREHHDLASQLGRRALARDGQRVRPREPRVAAQQLDAVALELVRHHGDLALQHVVEPVGQVLQRDVLLDAVAEPVEAALPKAGEVQDGLAQGLARDRAGVGDAPADRCAPLDRHDARAQLGGLDRRALPCGTGPDDHHVVAAHHAHPLPLARGPRGSTHRR